MAPAALVAATTLGLGLADGGYFATATATAAIVLGIGLVLALMLLPGPVGSLSAAGRIGTAAFAALAGWVLLSSAWSGAAARTLLEFDRVLLYGFAFALGALTLTNPPGTRWALRLLWAALATLGTVGLLSRFAPGLVEAPLTLVEQRLSHPLGYWNALGIVAGLGCVLAVGLAADRREPTPIRMLTAASLPALALALYLTFSRGAILATLLGLGVVLLLGRPQGAFLALAASVPTASLTLLVASASPGLIRSSGVRPTAGDVPLGALAALVACSVAAALAMSFGVSPEPLDRRRLGEWAVGLGRRIVVLGPLLLVVGVVLAIGTASQDDQGGRSTQPAPAAPAADPRERLTEVDSSGRLELWRVALGAFAAAPLHGTGAGTFPRTWAQETRRYFLVQDAHSLPLETLAELGLVGGVLLAVAIGAGLWAALGGRARDRETSWLILAVAFAWLAHASLDWDWEMPATTLPVVALLGAATGSRADRRSTGMAGRWWPRTLAALVVLTLLMTPVQVGLSQQRLARAIDAFSRGDCPRTVDAALDSIDVLAHRPEPYELLAYCNARAGRSLLAVADIAQARRRDPGDWTLRYESAVVLAASGQDPRPELRTALELNPNEPLLLEARRRFDSEAPAAWRRTARSLVLPIPFAPITPVR